MPLLGHAIDYGLIGWPVIPLIGKQPATRHGSRDWTVSPIEMAKKAWPGIGLCTGYLFFVLDIDGDAGAKSMVGKTIPDTPTVKTRNGHHYYFALPRGRAVTNCAGILPGVDIRGLGGYVVAPPSPHPDGGVYRWSAHYNNHDMADAPEWLLRELFREKKIRPARHHNHGGEFDVRNIPAIHKGQRNDRLFRLGCAAFSRGKQESDVLAELTWINDNRCDEPVSERELNAIVSSASRHRI